MSESYWPRNAPPEPEPTFDDEVEAAVQPAVAPQPDPVVVVPAEVSDDPPELLTVEIDTYVEPAVEQRLIQYWLLNGPVEWRANIVMEAPPPTEEPPGVEHSITHPNPERRRIGPQDDGVWRMIKTG